MAPPSSPRDFVGYGRRPPRAPWPGSARIAVSLVLNYEEGAEQAIPDGDPKSKPLGEAARDQIPGRRDLAIESMFEYGSRAGVWRLLDCFDSYRVPATVFAAAVAVERNAELAAYLRTAPLEVCCHGYRWEDVSTLGEAVEREHIARAVASLTNTVCFVALARRGAAEIARMLGTEPAVPRARRGERGGVS
jgi:allantoinase